MGGGGCDVIIYSASKVEFQPLHVCYEISTINLTDFIDLIVQVDCSILYIHFTDVIPFILVLGFLLTGCDDRCINGGQCTCTCLSGYYGGRCIFGKFQIKPHQYCPANILEIQNYIHACVV